MSAKLRRHQRLPRAAALGVTLCSGLLVAASATGATSTGTGTTKLQTKLNSAKSQLDTTQTHQQSLAGNISALNGQVSSLAGQINLVQSREATAQAQLTGYDTALSQTKSELSTERERLNVLKRRLRHASTLLGAQLRSQYEQPDQSFVSLLVNANGFNQLLSQLQYLDNAKLDEQKIIRLTRTARSQTESAAARIGRLERADLRAANAAAAQTDALSGMNSLLSSRQAALNLEREAQATALAASQAKGSQLRSAIHEIQVKEAAARQAAQTFSGGGSTGTSTTSTSTTTTTSTTGTSPTSTPTSPGTGGDGLSGSGGWAIPYAIVLCESGGQDLPPNGAGASGYYQIIPGTWKLFGGTGRAAYQASKAEQGAVAAKIWDGGAGASNWSCSSVVGAT
jgi:septal ring factor EnvC (AmiA/AmiB activator)